MPGTESRGAEIHFGPLSLGATLLSVVATLGALAGWLWPAALVLLLACLVLILVGVRFGGSWATLLVVFLVFHAVYGLSGPMAVLMGAPLPNVYGPPFRVQEFLVAVGLATGALSLGLAVVKALLPWDPRAFRLRDLARVGSPTTGIALIGLGSAMEVINCIRAGGWRLIILGKAVYQSEVDALVLTLPSGSVVALGLAVLALSLARGPGARRRWLSKGQALALVLAATPVLLITMALGYRAPLMEWFLVGVLGLRYLNPIPRLGPRVLAVILLLYVASGLVFSNRAVIAYGFLTGNWRTAGEMSLTGERLLLALNPAATEFGSAFGNYSEYLNRSGALPALGETYVRGLTTPIPGFLYPGDKPQQAAYEFRDRFFPGLASQGAIAGTAYSSILESFVNFGPAGALFVYLIVGLGLGFAERGRWRAGRAGVHLLYLMLAVQAVAFHRSDLSSVIAATVIAGFIVVTYLTLRALSVALGATLLPTPAGGRGDHGTSQPGLEETA